jgi:hypothetical protein
MGFDGLKPDLHAKQALKSTRPSFVVLTNLMACHSCIRSGALGAVFIFIQHLLNNGFSRTFA